MDIAKEIEQEIAKVNEQVSSGQLTKEQGIELLNELKNVYGELDKANKELVARAVVNAVSVLAKIA